jgi:hypothetical protein
MDFAEFQKTFPSLDPEAQRQFFAILDVDGDGRVEFQEFVVKIALLNERIKLDNNGSSNSSGGGASKPKTPREEAAEADRFRRAVELSYVCVVCVFARVCVRA